MKEIRFLLELQIDSPKVLCSIFRNPVTAYEGNQGAIALAVAPKYDVVKNNIAIKYHHFQSYVANGDVDIQHIDTRVQIAYIFMKPLDAELFRYICYKLNCWYINGILICEGV